MRETHTVAVKHRTLSARISCANLATFMTFGQRGPCTGSSKGGLTLEVVGPEGMAPFGDTMRFVNGDQADFGGVYHLDKAFVIQPFWGHVPKDTSISTFIGCREAHTIGDIAQNYHQMKH